MAGAGPGGQEHRGFASEDDEAQHWLGRLRDGSRQEKITARLHLARIFERRAMLDEAAELYEANIYAGVRDPELYERLAQVYKQRGDAELAYEVRLEADKLWRTREDLVTLPPRPRGPITQRAPIAPRPRPAPPPPRVVSRLPTPSRSSWPILAIALGAPTAQLAQAPPTMSPEEAVDSIERYTVLVVTDQGTGTGISLGDGRVLTAYHVVDDARQVAVRFASGRREQVAVTRIDQQRDLGLLASSFTDEPEAPLADVASLRQGETLDTLGYPMTTAIGAQDATLNRGVFSGRWQSPKRVWHVQTDAQVNPGNSGGPLADSRGKLVGVVTFGIRGAEGLNF